MPDSPDVVERITRFNRGRDPERLALKYKAMAHDALAFFRGTCHLFAEDWPRGSALDAAPAVWVCGDFHIENAGTYRGDNRQIYFDIGDFDEGLLAPCTWDLTRLAASALLAARIHRLKHKRALALCNVFLESYADALREGKARWIERDTAQGLIRSLLHGLEQRRQSTFIASRTTVRKGKRRLKIDGEHTLETTKDDRRFVKRWLRKFARDQSDPGYFRFVDVARRIAGTGSLGLERYVILVEGSGGLAGNALLDLKLAPPSALARYVKTRQPRWASEAERVVGVGTRMQAIAPARLCAVSIQGKPYVLRELMPSQDKLDLSALKGRIDLLDPLARDIGALLAWSELRSGARNGSATIDELIAFADAKRWRSTVSEYADHYHDVAWRDWEAFRAAWRAEKAR
jgi:uncharacterized protein (DUF2252 family)